MGPRLAVVADALLQTPFAASCRFVGGCVRDGLLGIEGDPDVDVVVEGDAQAVAQALYELGVAAGPPAVFARFGTARVAIDDIVVELASARKESYQANSRKPSVEGASFADDALRRDFTVNALLLRIEDGAVEDPLGRGLDDLRARQLRTPREPTATFVDDPLRMYRAVRFRWKLGLTPVAGLWESVSACSPRVSILSAERVRDEVVKMLVLPRVGEALGDLMELGLLSPWVPELAEGIGLEQGEYHHLDVWDHTRAVVANAPPELTTRLAALLHDVAKPRTRTVEDSGRIRFFGHDRLGAEMTAEIMDRLRFPASLARDVALLVRHHMRFGMSNTMGPSGLRRAVRDLGPQLSALLDLVEADGRAHRPGLPTLDVTALRSQLDEAAQATPAPTLVSPLRGDEIQDALGIAAGPEVGRWKAELTEAVIRGELVPGDVAGATRWLQAARNALHCRAVPQD